MLDKQEGRKSHLISSCPEGATGSEEGNLTQTQGKGNGKLSSEGKYAGLRTRAQEQEQLQHGLADASRGEKRFKYDRGAELQEKREQKE